MEQCIPFLEKISKLVSIALINAENVKTVYHKQLLLGYINNYINDCTLATKMDAIIYANRSAQVILRRNDIVGKSLSEVYGSRNSHIMEIYMR